jgi:radical SAM protein with 4Fe4S-binding SPASM domain
MNSKHTQEELLKLPRKQGFRLILKPTSECNLSCEYCYDKPARNTIKDSRMTLDTFTHTIKLVNAYAKDVFILWHGGEPLLMGEKWYRDCYKILNRHYATDFHQAMQTNGLCIQQDPTLKEMFNDCEIDYGFSYDGEDATKRHCNHKGYMQDLLPCMLGESRCSKKLLTIVHSDNIEHLINHYNYIKSTFKGKYNLLTQIAFSTKTSELPYTVIDSDLYKKCMTDFYTYIMYDNSKTAICDNGWMRLLDALYMKYKVCEFTDCADLWIAVLADGTLSPCNRWSSSRPLGNIKDFNSIEEIQQTLAFRTYYDETRELLKICKDCEVFDACQAGCFAVKKNDYEHCEIRERFEIAYKVLAGLNPTTPYNKTLIQSLIRRYHTPSYLVSFAVNSVAKDSYNLANLQNKPFHTKEFLCDRLFANLNLSLQESPSNTLEELLQLNQELLLQVASQYKYEILGIITGR